VPSEHGVLALPNVDLDCRREHEAVITLPHKMVELIALVNLLKQEHVEKQ